MAGLIFIIIMMVQHTTGVIYKLNDEEYNKMPAVYQLDPYESCLQEPGGVYCSVELLLVSDTHNSLLTMIQEYSDHTKRHFNHTKLRHGVCVSKKCSEALEEGADLKWSLEGCFNKSFFQTYGLKTRVTDYIYCDKHGETKNIDTADILVAILCITLLILNLIGSFNEFYARRSNKKRSKLLSCFSVSQNWQSLVSPSETKTETLRTFQGIHGFRTISTLTVIGAHCMLPYTFNIENPKYFEEAYDCIIYHIAFNGPALMQTFFIISASLLVYHNLRSDRRMTWTMIPKFIVSRWIRLTPSYAVVLAFTATWTRFLGTGPLWKYIVEQEARECRETWWWNLLYINNHNTSQCMGPTWYLAADMQLYIIGVLFIVLVKQSSRVLMLRLMFLAGILTPALYTYFYDLEAIVTLSPEVSRSFFMEDPTFFYVYGRGITNLAGFTVGLALGILVCHCQKNKVDIHKYRKYRLIYWAMAPVLLGLILHGSIFYADRPRHHILIRVMYAALVKPLIAIVIAVIMGGVLLKYENGYRSFMEWRGWTIPARLSYSVYLVHMIIFRTSLGTSTSLNPMSFINIIITFTWSAVSVFLAAVPFYVLVEAPLNRLQKMLLHPEEKRNE